MGRRGRAGAPRPSSVALGRAFPQLSPVAGVGCGRGAARWGAARAWQIQRGPREGRAPKLPQKPWRRPAGQRSRWCRSTAPLLLGCSQDVRAWGGAPRKPAASLPVGSGAGCPRTWGLRHVPASTSFPSLPPPPGRSVGGPLPEGNAWQCLPPLLFLRRVPARPLWLDRRQPGRATSPRAPALRPSHPTVHPPESPHTAAEAGTSKIREGANPLLTSSGITRHLLTHSRSHWEPCLGSCGSVPPPSPPHVFLNHFGTPLNLCFFFSEFFHFGVFFFFFLGFCVFWFFCFVLFFGFFFFFFFCHSLWVPGSGSNGSCSHRPTPEPQLCQIPAESGTYNTARGNAGSLSR